MNLQPSLYQVGVIGLGQIAWSVDEDPQRRGIWSHIGAYEASPNQYMSEMAIRPCVPCESLTAFGGPQETAIAG